MQRTGLLLKVVLGLVILGVVALALYIIYTLFVNPLGVRGAHMWFSTIGSSVPDEVEHATYLLAPWNAGMIYRDGSFDWRIHEANRQAVDYTEEAGATAAIVRNPVEASYEVYLNWARIGSSSSPIQAIALSPAGTHVLYSRVRGDEWPRDLSYSWDVILGSSDGSAQVLGSGFAAAFLDDTTILRVTPAGFVLQDVDGTVLQVIEHRLDASSDRLAYAKDRARIALTTEDGSALVYSYDPAARALTQQTTLPVPGVQSLALSADALYAVNLHADRSATITRYPLDGGEPKVVRTLDPTVAAIKMIF